MGYNIVLNFTRAKFLVEKTSTKVTVTGKQIAWYIDPTTSNKIILDTSDISLNVTEEASITDISSNDEYKTLVESLEETIKDNIKTAFTDIINDSYEANIR